jgi:Ca2+-binding RTX toxin-like protein
MLSAGEPPAREKLAARLLRLDPGARVGGSTQVATTKGALLMGVPGRVNFMMALGRRQRIIGGAGPDQLGAHGTAAARIHARSGPDLIHCGAGHDRLEGGRGHDRFIDRRGATTVVTGPGRNQVDVADGANDRVLCAPGSTNRIVADRGDRLHPDCRRQASTVRYRRPPRGAPTARAAQQQTVTGEGTNEIPTGRSATTRRRSTAS